MYIGFVKTIYVLKNCHYFILREGLSLVHTFIRASSAIVEEYNAFRHANDAK